MNVCINAREFNGGGCTDCSFKEQASTLVVKTFLLLVLDSFLTELSKSWLCSDGFDSPPDFGANLLKQITPSFIAENFLFALTRLAGLFVLLGYVLTQHVLQKTPDCISVETTKALKRIRLYRGERTRASLSVEVLHIYSVYFWKCTCPILYRASAVHKQIGWSFVI